MPAKGNDKKAKEPVLLIKPASKLFGLDYLHITLLVLVVILVLLAFAVSTFKPGQTILNCPYGINQTTGNCLPEQMNTNATLALSSAEQILAQYSLINSSLSLLPYYSEVNKANVSYLSNQNRWLVVVPYLDPLANNATFYVSLLLYGNNYTLAQPFIETAAPIYPTKNQVVGLGVVQISGKVLCSSTQPFPVYTLVDPYAPGALSALYQSINASAKYSKTANVSYKFIFTGYAASLYPRFGVNQTQLPAVYLWCASNQPRFLAFLKNYSIVYSGTPVANYTLQQTAIGSGLNMTQLNSCLLQAPRILNNQAALAKFYNITTTPTIIVNCKYQTIPQTLGYAINFVANQTT